MAPAGRWHGPQLAPEDRAQAVEALMVDPPATALRRFAGLLGLSAVVAAVGLLQDSTAVVIGAMMIAPLMAPILGIAASLVMGWGTRLLTGMVVVACSVGGVVAVAYAITQFLPAAGTGLPAEVLGRSSPDVRDMLVALAAGAAGAFATVRRQISGALPGVAVAVALVPPLACVGVLLGRGQPGLARGAALLFAANLFGIVLAASVVFVLTGFVPVERVGANRRRLLTTLAITAAPAVLVGTVLTIRFLTVAAEAHDLEVATRAVVGWLGSADDLREVVVRGDTVEVNVTSRTSPPPLTTLTGSLREALGKPTTVDLRWTPVREPEPTVTPAAGPGLEVVRPVVEEWLTSQSLTLEGLSYNSSTLVVSSSGAQPPEDGEGLADRIEERFGVRLPISLAWTRTTAQDPSPTVPADTSVLAARTAAEAWSAAHAGSAVLAVDHSGASVTVTIIGVERPVVSDLEADLRAALPQMTITVQWVPGSVLGRSTPSPTTIAGSGTGADGAQVPPGDGTVAPPVTTAG